MQTYICSDISLVIFFLLSNLGNRTLASSFYHLQILSLILTILNVLVFCIFSQIINKYPVFYYHNYMLFNTTYTQWHQWLYLLCTITKHLNKTRANLNASLGLLKWGHKKMISVLVMNKYLQVWGHRAFFFN